MCVACSVRNRTNRSSRTFAALSPRLSLSDFFDIQHPFLRGALDRFAQFFLCPLFTEGATDREMKAVDSENSKNLQSDAWRCAHSLP